MPQMTNSSPSDPSASWPSLEIAKLSAGLLTPLVVVGFGWILNRRLKNIEQSQWQSRKIIEKRLELYDAIAPELNKLYCFFRWIGYWKEISPTDAISSKRNLDKTINIYRHLLNEEFYDAYNAFIHTIFRTYQGPGLDAKLVSRISGPNGDRMIHSNYEWDSNWNSLFHEPDLEDLSSIDTKYSKTMDILKNSIEIDNKTIRRYIW